MTSESASQTVVVRYVALRRHSTHRISWMGPCALLVPLLFGLSGIEAGTPFNPPPCTLPFDAIKVHQAIDDACDTEGSEPDTGHKLQNSVKNHFCATGPPVHITAAMFRSLQKIIDQKAAAGEVKYGNRKDLPTSRTVFVGPYALPGGVSLGEGRLVRFAGFIQRAHAGGDESCNCDRPLIENHDIHLDLAATKNAAECNRIIAEVSPHWRPDTWLTRKFTKVKNQGFPVRITGQLMFDAAHVACNRGGVKRMTEWEVHPVYQVDVATTKNLPSASDDLKWVSLEKWLTNHP
jgi:hypothetical protein